MLLVENAGPPNWKPPVEERHMSFDEWLEFALVHDNATIESPHMYFRTHRLFEGIAVCTIVVAVCYLQTGAAAWNRLG
jgi:hypothetical protein